MIEDKIILPICSRWAKMLWQKGLDYDELVSIAYCVSKPLPEKTPEGVIASWIKLTLLKTIYQSDLIKIGKHNNKAKYNEVLENFYNNYKLIIKDHQDELDRSGEDKNLILDIQQAIDGLSEDEAQIIYMRFWLGKTFSEIAKEFDKNAPRWAMEQVNRIIGLLKNKVLR